MKACRCESNGCIERRTVAWTRTPCVIVGDRAATASSTVAQIALADRRTRTHVDRQHGREHGAGRGGSGEPVAARRSNWPGSRSATRSVRYRWRLDFRVPPPPRSRSGSQKPITAWPPMSRHGTLGPQPVRRARIPARRVLDSMVDAANVVVEPSGRRARCRRTSRTGRWCADSCRTWSPTSVARRQPGVRSGSSRTAPSTATIIRSSSASSPWP